MRRRAAALFAIFAALIVVASMPASAANLVVISHSTTDADFDAGTLTDVSVQGSGDAAYVQFSGANVIDDFEDGSTGEWTLASGTNKITPESTIVYAGSFSGDQTSGQSYRGLGTSITDGTLQMQLRFSSTSSTTFLYLQDSSGATGPQIRIDSGNIDRWDGSSWQTIGSAPAEDTWTQFEFDADTGTDTYDLIVGGSTVATGIDFSSDISAVERFQIFEQGGNPAYIDNLEIPAAAGTYVSSNRTLSNADSVRANLSLTDVEADVQIEAWDGGQWVAAGSDTFTTDGNKSIPVTTDADKYRTSVTFTTTGSNPDGRLHDVSYLYQTHDPEINDSSASPSGGEELTAQDVPLEIDVSDTDFGTVQDDTVTIDWYVDGSKENTTQLNSNGTASHTHDFVTGGDREWSIVATDSYGNTDTSQNFSIEVPATLEIRNESSPNDLVNESEVEVTFYQGENVITREATDGTVGLSGLPVGGQMVVSASATDYRPRRIILSSIYQQSSVYLLPENETADTIVFQLDDSTGRFPPSETQLFIERPLNVSGNTSYQIIVSDNFSATGEVVTDLATDERYRLRVTNQQGETRLLGHYITSGDAQAIVPISQVQIGGSGESGAQMNLYAGSEGGHRFVRMVYFDPDRDTGQVTYEITTANGSHTLRGNQTSVGTYGVFVETVNLTQAGVPAYEDQFVVNWTAERDGKTIGGQAKAGTIDGIADRFDIDPMVLSLIGWVSLVAITGLVVIYDPPLAALAAAIWAAALALLGVTDIPAAGIGIAGVVGLLANVGRVR